MDFRGPHFKTGVLVNDIRYVVHLYGVGFSPTYFHLLPYPSIPIPFPPLLSHIASCLLFIFYFLFFRTNDTYCILSSIYLFIYLFFEQTILFTLKGKGVGLVSQWANNNVLQIYHWRESNLRPFTNK